ncbi:MAG: hypothetical protein H0X33_13520 [Taibaiella sp.]|nr:hypothetical protein [Taibaiella sp.]
MKKIIVTYLTAISGILAMSYSSFAQVKSVDIKNIKSTAHAVDGARIVDSNSAKFIGTWVYDNGEEEVTIILDKTLSTLGSGPKHIEMELINGGYKYIKQGKIIANTLQTKPMYGTSKGKDDELTLSITNEKTNKATLIVVKLIDKNSIKINLSEQRGEGINPDRNLNLPLNITLVRK